MDPMCTCLWNVFFLKFIIYVSLICFQAKALEFIDNNKVSLWQVCDILLEQLCIPWTAVYPLDSCVSLVQLLACTSNGADVC